MIQPSANYLAANASLQKKPVIRIEIDTYTRVFTTIPTGISGEYDWLESIEDLGTTISDLDGSADLGQLVFTVQDVANLITGDFPGFVFEGKKIVLKHGFVGLATADYITLFTGLVDSIASVNQGASYRFTCTDNKQRLTRVVYTVADDGRPTDSNHLRTLNGHPIDLLISLLTTELGLTPGTDFNSAKLLLYRDGVFAGLNFVFSIDTPPAAGDFIQQQIMVPLGCYMWTNSRGQIDFNFFYRDNRSVPGAGSLIAAFADGTGQLVARPFLCNNSVKAVAPSSATQLLLGVADVPYTDNSGSWQISVNGASPVTVQGTAGPWSLAGGLNSAYPYSNSGASAPTSVAITGGTLVTIEYVSGLVSIGIFDPGSDARGNPDPTFSPYGANNPGAWAYLIASPALSQFDFTADNITAIPEADQADLVNTLSVKFDKDSGGTFEAISVQSFSLSTSRYGLYGQEVIESDGMRSGFQGFFLAALTSRLIFYRYGLKNLLFEELTAFWPACIVEPGDIVSVTSEQVPDRDAGVKGISGKLFEVLDRALNFEDGIVTLKVLDASYLTKFGQYQIAPDSTSDFTSATSDEQSVYMFMANDSDQYSDTTPAHQLG